MKICHVCAVDFTLKRLLLPLIDAQLAQGHSVSAVCSSGKHVKCLRADGYLIHSISISRSFSLRQAILSIWHLFWLFRREKFDVVHVHTPVAAIVGRIAATFARTPLVVYTAHGFYFHDDMPAPKKLFFIFLEQLMRPFTDLLFTQSSEDAENAVRLRIMPPRGVYAIGNGVDKEKFNQKNLSDNTAVCIPKGNVVIGMVSRLVSEKGIVEFLEAAKILSLDNKHLSFLLIGSRLPSDHDKNVSEAISRAEEILGEQLILTGEREDIPALLSLIDVFCLPSWREGMPRSIIEAMMMELPVVATNIRGSREEVVDGVTGFLIPPKNILSLVEKLGLLIHNSEMRVEFGKAGRKRAISLYDENIIIDRQLKYLSEHLGNIKGR